MLGSWPGWTFIIATLFENLVSSFGFESDLAGFSAYPKLRSAGVNVFRISIFSGVILAMGSVLIALNVSLLDVCIFFAL